jgi:two-component system invasion response regulator UvrY
MIYVAIADDHILMRKGVVEIITSFGEFRVIIEADNGLELIDAIQESYVKPDICILDISMPVMNGYETLIEIKSRWPEIKVLVLTMINNEFSVLKMLRGGANGYLLKACPPKDLYIALDAVYKYKIYHSELVADEERHHDKKIPLAPNQNITDKEMVFLKYCCSDMHYKEMAEHLDISVRTVHTYRDTLFNKLGIKTRIGLAVYALSIGITPIEGRPRSKKKSNHPPTNDIL